jgi:lipopolysaccharide export system protein LptA
MKIIYGVMIFGLYFVHLSNAFGQQDSLVKNVQIIKADRMDVMTIKGKQINKFKGNVVLKHGGTYFYCDSAYQFNKESKKELEAFGKITIVQKDSVLLSGNHLLYDTNSQKVSMKGDVVLHKDKKFKRRKFLKYSLK